MCELQLRRILTPCFHLYSPLGIPQYVSVDDKHCSCSGSTRELHREHICTVAYTLPEGDTLYVTNVYNRISDRIPEGCLSAHLNYDGYLFVAGDFNMHDPDWERDLDKPTSKTTPLTRRFKARYHERGLQLLTDTNGEPTYIKADRFSVLDLTWASLALQCSQAKLRSDLTLPGVDHVAIETTGQVSADDCPVLIWLWKHANIKAMEGRLEAYIKRVQALPLDTRSQVSARARGLVQTMQAIQDAYVPRVVRSRRQLYDLRTPEIEKLSAQVEAARIDCENYHRHARRMQQSWGAHPRLSKAAIWEPYGSRWRKWDDLHRQLTKLLDIEFKRRYRLSMTNLDKWMSHSYSKRKRRARARAPVTVPNLVVKDEHGNNVGYATTPHEKALTLHGGWYGERRPCDEVDEPSCCVPETPECEPPSSRSQIVTKARMRRIFRRLKLGKAAGVDEIGPRFLIEFKEQLIPYVARLWSACCRLAHVPNVFDTGRTIPVPKPLGPGALYNLPNQLRPICLSSTLGKTLESYLADELAKIARERNLLPATQMAARGRSTTMALLYILRLIEAARETGVAISIMCLDQKGAFNHVTFRELERVFRAKGIPEWMIAMVSSYMCGRKTTIRISGFESEPLGCGGVPQGSPLSSILFAFFTSGLLEVQEFDTEKGRVFKLAYSDDTYVIVIGKSLRENKVALAHQYRLCVRWANSSGASFGAAKTKVIHFASPQQNDDGPMSKYIPGFNDELEYDCTTTGKDHHMTILGVRFAVDAHGNLDWAAHWRYLDEVFHERFAGFQRIVHPTYGLSMLEAVDVFKAGVVSAILTNNVIWLELCEGLWFLRDPSHPFRADDDPSESYSRSDIKSSKLLFAQHSVRAARWSQIRKWGEKCHRLITSAMQGTPHWYCRAELNLEPLEVIAYRSAVATLANIMGTPEWDTICSAKERVRDYARSNSSERVPELRGGRGRRVMWPSTMLEEQAAEWREKAVRDIERRDQLPRRKKRDRAEFEDDSSDVDADEPISDRLADLLREQMGDSINADDDDDADAGHDGQPKVDFHQRVKLRLKTLLKDWAFDTVKKHHEHWRKAKFDRFVAAHPDRPMPPALRTKWDRRNPKRYRNLSRPLDYVLFALRTEYIGLLQHRRELCRSKMDDSYCRLCKDRFKGRLETVYHLLHFCPALKPQRDKLYAEVYATVREIRNKHDMRRLIIDKAPKLVAQYALRYFPIDQLEWTRTHMLDLLSEADGGGDGD